MTRSPAPSAAVPSEAEQLRSARQADGSAEPHPDFGWALATLLRAYVHAADTALDDLPGGSRAFRLLASVARDDLPSQLAVAHSAGLDRTVVTYLLDDLAAAGLVERRPDPSDRRARRVVLTGAGRLRLEEIEDRLRSVEDEVLASLDARERAQLRALVRRVAGELRDLEPTTCRHVVEMADGAGCEGS